jgi:hypothetical protein
MESALAFIHETTERFLPSAPAEMPGTSSIIPRQRIPNREPMEEKRPLRRQPDDHHFCSLIMLAVTAGGFLLVTWAATKALSFNSLRSLESRLAKARPCFERLSRVGNVRTMRLSF